MPLDFACPDWADRLARGETPIADLPLDDAAADRAVQIFNRLRLPDVPDQPTLAEAAGEWMRDIVRAAFGSMQRNAGGQEVRQVGEVFVLVPKKNAKTTSAAAIALTFMLVNRRRNADMLIIGPTQKISETAFEQARGMIDADPEGFLQKRFHVQDHKKTIRCRVTGARLMIRTFGMDVLTGAKPIFALIDEVHILGQVPYAADVIRQIRGGMLPFPESLLVMITTQSDHPPQGVFRSELDYARAVRDGQVTERVRTLPVLYEFPEEIQRGKARAWTDAALWHLVTPNLGRSVTIDALLDGFERAKADGETEVVAWATQHLNIEVGVGLRSTSWIGATFWEDATDPELTDLDALMARSEVAVVGIDGGGLDDLLGLAVIGREKDTRRWLLWTHAWAHPEVLETRKEIAGLLRDFARQGDLTILTADDKTGDVVGVADVVERLIEAGLLPKAGAVGLDPYGVSAIVDELSFRGMQDEQLAGIPQGTRLSPAIWGMERKLKDGTLVHGGRPMMAWVLGNAKTEQRGSAVMITKEVAGKAKIDPLVAAFDAFVLMSRNPEPAGGPSSYLDADEMLVL
jgi:phage terminase large subunit-like protein